MKWIFNKDKKPNDEKIQNLTDVQKEILKILYENPEGLTEDQIEEELKKRNAL